MSELEDDVLMQLLEMAKRLDEYKKTMKALEVFLQSLTPTQKLTFPQKELRELYEAVKALAEYETMRKPR